MFWRHDPRDEISIEMGRWLCVACAFIFFGFFGFADEAKKNYRSALRSVAKCIRYSCGTFGKLTAVVNSSEYVSFPRITSALMALVRLSKSGNHSQLGSPPDIGREKLGRKNSFETPSSSPKDLGGLLSPASSVNGKNSNPTNIFGSKKKFNGEILKSTFQNDMLDLPNIGETLANHSSGEISLVPSSGLWSSTSRIPIPEPAVTHSESSSTELHSALHISFPVDVPVSVLFSEDPRQNSHGMV